MIQTFTRHAGRAARTPFVFALLLLAASALAETNRWDAEIAAFATQDRTNPPPKQNLASGPSPPE